MSEPTTTPPGSQTRIFGIIALVVFGGLSVNYVLRHTRPIEVERSGKVVAIDYETRKAQLEFIHPKTGSPFVISGSVPVDCVIERNGQGCQLSEIKPGAQVRAKGKLYPLTKEIVATHVSDESPPAELVSDGAPAPTSESAGE